MRKIIIYRGSSIDSDVFLPVNYDRICNDYSQRGGGNVGNKLFNQAIEKYISNDYTQYDYIYYDEIHFIPIVGNVNFDEINENYNLVIMPQANIFCDSLFHKKLLNMWTAGISNFKIPVYVLGVGIQVRSPDEIIRLSKNIETESKNFIDAVYKSGGEFSLRGYYTKEFFRLQGFNDAVVTGCPSFYQKGRQLSISNDKVEKSDLRIALNGRRCQFYNHNFKKIINEIETSYYLDQDEFLNQLYNKFFFDSVKFPKRKGVLRAIPLYALKMIHEKRFFLFYDLVTRFSFFKEKGINFSYGSRIHGNIMAMLNGIPAYVVTEDLRTRELAEFFHIPYSPNVSKDIYETYLRSDYSAFNAAFPGLYDNFEKFLLDHNIIEKELQFPNKFDLKISSIVWQKPVIINDTILDSYFSMFVKNFLIYEKLETLLEQYSKVIRKLNLFFRNTK